MNRVFTYQIPAAFCGHKISEYLKSVHFSEKILASLRQDENSIRLDQLPVHMNQLIEKPCTLSVSLSEDSGSTSGVDSLGLFSAGKVLPVKAHLQIVYEDDDILIIDKPAAMPIHPSRQEYEHTLGNAVMYYYQSRGFFTPFRCINRLDKDTSGLTIIAKNRIIAAMLNDAMQRREIYREYTAIVEGSLSGSGTLSMPIAKEDLEGSILRYVDYKNGQSAITHYESTPVSDSFSLVRLHLDTGRTHQIRVHMKEIGHPLIGDRLYNPANHLMNRQALHAGYLRFVHPYSGEALSFNAALPADMQTLIDSATTAL